MIDFHTHVLHNIDDGAQDLSTAIAMLEEAKANGTDTLVVSPHYYPRFEEGLDSFLTLRSQRFQELKEASKGRDVPELRLAAEVNVCTQFSDFSRVKELCLEGTDYMLIEMPFVTWEEWMLECVYNLTVKGIIPIVVHIDRYMHYPPQAISALNELFPLYQISSEAMLSHQSRKMIFDLFKSGKAHVMGSDMHNMKIRKNTLHLGYDMLKSRFGQEYIEYFENNGSKILNNEKNIKAQLFASSKKSRLFI